MVLVGILIRGEEQIQPRTRAGWQAETGENRNS